MDILLELITSDAITFGGITVALIYYILKNNNNREKWLKEHLEKSDANMSEITNLMLMLKSEMSIRIDNLEDKIDDLKIRRSER